MTDLAALADRLERQAAAMAKAEAESLADPYNRPKRLAFNEHATGLGYSVEADLPAILSALRASRPEPAADAVEAVAEAIWKYQLAPFEPGWAYESEGAKKHFRECASAALSALPRPAVDEGMRAALVRIREIAEASDEDKLAATVALDDIADEVTAALAAAQEGA